MTSKLRKLMGIFQFWRQYSYFFNTPIRFDIHDWYTNERIVEIAFVHKNMPIDGHGKCVLEFGCSRSDLAIQLASLGYEVVGIDLRHYPFSHPRLNFHQKNILQFEEERKFDFITAISTLEHIGLGAYGEDHNQSDLYRVISKLQKLLKLDGKIIFTVPIGKSYKDEFLRSFTNDEILKLFNELKLTNQAFFYRRAYKYWNPCNIESTKNISNARSDRGLTGINCVGCFVFSKLE